MAFFQRLRSLFGGAQRPTARETVPQALAVAEELRRSGRLDEAIETLRISAAASPSNVGFHVALGRDLLLAERYDDAVAALQDALKLDRENLVAIRQLAEAYLRKGEKVEAIKKLKLYRGLKPGDRDVAELIEKIGLELRPTSPVPEVPPKEITTAPVVPPAQPPPSPQGERPPDTAPIERPPAAAVQPSGPPSEAPAQPAFVSAPAASLEAATPLPAGEAPAAPQAPSPAVTETLADLYRAQGYVAEARSAYTALAETEPDARRREALREKAESAARAPLATTEARLRAFLSRLPSPGRAAEDMGAVLRELVERADGVRSVALTDLEGLPVVSAGAPPESAELEALIAELTAFWKGVGRIDGDVGTGPLDTLTLSAENGGAVVSSVSPDYALIVHAEPGAPMGRIRYEAARAAWLLRPALG